MRGTSSIAIARSRRPCTTSNPAVLLHHTAAAWRALRAWRSRASSLNTTSAASKMRSGSACERFSRTVLSRPGRSDVRTTWNSSVLGFPILTAVALSSGMFSHSKFSSWEHWAAAGSERACACVRGRGSAGAG